MFIKLLFLIMQDSCGGLGISQASLVSSVCDKTGDDSVDAQAKVKRLINECGPEFCLITNWPFTRDDISFSITSANYKYSGSSYLPQTFRKVLGANISDSNSDQYPLYEKSVNEMRTVWVAPARNSGRPDEFVVTRPESDYWEIAFNRLPDRDYTVYMEIEKQWVDLTASNETLITKEFFGAFSHFVAMARMFQQGDTEGYALLKAEWWDAQTPRNSILGRIQNSLSGPSKRKQVKVDERMIFDGGRNRRDYN